MRWADLVVQWAIKMQCFFFFFQFIHEDRCFFLDERKLLLHPTRILQNLGSTFGFVSTGKLSDIPSLSFSGQLPFLY
jgi:hypothetical protein